MEQTRVLEVLKEVKADKKRNFTQSYDFIINLKSIDLKKTDQQLDYAIGLHYTVGKKKKVCALVGPELAKQAEEVCDKVVSVEQFPDYQDKKIVKKLANEFDFFIAQATIMPKVAVQFGKVFGPRGKMPNPKLGCVVPPTANLKPLYEKLQKTVGIKAKAQPLIQVMVGTEAMKDEEVADNVLTVYNSVVHHLPNEKNNIRSLYLKTTMSKAKRLDAEREEKMQKKAPARKTAGAAKEKTGKEKKEEKKVEKQAKETPKEESKAEPKSEKPAEQTPKG